MITASTLLLSLLATAPQDQIVRVDGATLLGKLTSATLDEVRYEDADGQEQDVPGAQVFALRPGLQSELLRQGERLAEARDWANAASSFEAAVEEAETPFWQPPYAALRHAECLLEVARQDAARAGDAARAFSSWTTDHPDHWWLPRAQLGQARAMALAGDVEGASTLMQGLSDLAFEKSLPRHVEVAAGLVRAEAFLAGNQVDVAEARLRDLVRKAGEGATDPQTPRRVRARLMEQHAQAQILLGDAIEQKDGITAAASYWQGLSDDRSATPAVRAAALLGLARGARAGGELRQAQFLLARVVATLPAHRETAARALYELGDLTAELGDDPQPAKEYFQMILERFPATSWADRARERVGR